MTWFEAEQIYHYISQLETALEEWALSRYQMQTEQVELTHLNRKLNKEICGTLQPPKKNLLLGLFNRIQQCQSSIDERLKY
ncbi:MAG: hypothetical protein ISS71_03095 [Phycisphaerae bacterium]|nr:hypothetical protein [Phycisphaerae bacterium]